MFNGKVYHAGNRMQLEYGRSGCFPPFSAPSPTLTALWSTAGACSRRWPSTTRWSWIAGAETAAPPWSIWTGRRSRVCSPLTLAPPRLRYDLARQGLAKEQRKSHATFFVLFFLCRWLANPAPRRAGISSWPALKTFWMWYLITFRRSLYLFFVKLLLLIY